MSYGTCIIVGGGDGLGKSLAATFARNGCNIALVSRTEQGSQVARDAALKARPEARVSYFAADATRPEELEKICRTIQAEMGDVEVLIYNARGGYDPSPPLAMSYSALEQVYRLEVIGAFAAAKGTIPGMIERGRGCVLFSSATAAFRGSEINASYAIGKFGLRALSQSLAKAYAKSGIHVAHVRLDCTLDVPIVRKSMGAAADAAGLADTDAVAASYWWVYQQPKAAWSNEVELRPNTEGWTY